MLKKLFNSKSKLLNLALALLLSASFLLNILLAVRLGQVSSDVQQTVGYFDEEDRNDSNMGSQPRYEFFNDSTKKEDTSRIIPKDFSINNKYQDLGWDEMDLFQKSHAIITTPENYSSEMLTLVRKYYPSEVITEEQKTALALLILAYKTISENFYEDQNEAEKLTKYLLYSTSFSDGNAKAYNTLLEEVQYENTLGGYIEHLRKMQRSFLDPAVEIHQNQENVNLIFGSTIFPVGENNRAKIEIFNIILILENPDLEEKYKYEARLHFWMTCINESKHAITESKFHNLQSISEEDRIIKNPLPEFKEDKEVVEFIQGENLLITVYPESNQSRKYNDFYNGISEALSSTLMNTALKEVNIDYPVDKQTHLVLQEVLDYSFDKIGINYDMNNFYDVTKFMRIVEQFDELKDFTEVFGSLENYAVLSSVLASIYYVGQDKDWAIDTIDEYVN